MQTKTYSELITIPTFQERVEYLRTNSKVGVDTFGYDRIFNQRFYKSYEWKRIRNEVISRDNGCDLAMDGYFIPDGVPIYIHHMCPISLEDIQNNERIVLDPEYLITTTFETHNDIHYGLASNKPPIFGERKPNDTCPWRTK